MCFKQLLKEQIIVSIQKVPEFYNRILKLFGLLLQIYCTLNLTIYSHIFSTKVITKWHRAIAYNSNANTTNVAQYEQFT